MVHVSNRSGTEPRAPGKNHSAGAVDLRRSRCDHAGAYAQDISCTARRATVRAARNRPRDVFGKVRMVEPHHYCLPKSHSIAPCPKSAARQRVARAIEAANDRPDLRINTPRRMLSDGRSKSLPKLGLNTIEKVRMIFGLRGTTVRITR